MHGAVDVRNAEQHRGVVDQIPRGEVIGAVDDEVVTPRNLECVGGGDSRCVRLDVNVRVDVAQPFARGIEL